MTAWVMSSAVHSIDYMLYREGDLTSLRNFLQLLRSSLGLTVYDSNPAEDLLALDFTKKADAQFSLDFDDALHYATAKKHHGRTGVRAMAKAMTADHSASPNSRIR